LLMSSSCNAFGPADVPDSEPGPDYQPGIHQETSEIADRSFLIKIRPTRKITPVLACGRPRIVLVKRDPAR
jgi:hypothetical protein